MTVICTAKYDASKFDWTDPNPSEEASTLGGPGPFRMSPIYDDAADIGIVLVNPKTGAESVWYLAEKIPMGSPEDNEIGGWKFCPTPETLRKHPQLAGRTVTVWND